MTRAEEIIIALDAMGGDKAPDAVLQGANIVLGTHSHVRFLLFGDREKIEPILGTMPKLRAKSDLHHTPNYIDNHEKPSIALRKGKDSSMRLAIDAVKAGKAVALLSGGNTGALMAMSKLILRPLPGIDRPAIASVFPTKTGRCVLLDLGANVDCNSDNLVQFAIMGDAFAKVLLGLASPRVALLNVGEEQNKGSEVVKSAADDLKNGDYPINFTGYIEGNGIVEGLADVVVTDGFTGNVALKVAEGTGSICLAYIKEGFSGSPLAMLGGLLAKRSMKKALKKMDPRMHNGAMFLGLNGISVKSHGGTDGVGFANAINVAIELARNNINKKISDELAFYEGLFVSENSLEDEVEL